MVQATSRAFSKIPGTDHPSLDGKLYQQEGANILNEGLLNAGWVDVVANSAPDEKDRTVSNSTYMFSHGERGGLLATYLVSAAARSNFQLWTNTTVTRVIRSGGHISGVQVEATGSGGFTGVINVTASTGRVILAAGAFNTPKILFRSGIGPKDQLEVVKSSSDGPAMIGEAEWIDLPVGYGLNDHMNLCHLNMLCLNDWVLNIPDSHLFNSHIQTS